MKKADLGALAVAVSMFVLMSGACLRDALRGGDTKPEAHAKPESTQDAGRDAWSFQFTTIEQAASGGLGLSLIGWIVAAARAWRNGKDRDALILAVEQREQFPSAKPVKTYIRDFVKSPSLNRRVQKLIHPKGKP